MKTQAFLHHTVKGTPPQSRADLDTTSQLEPRLSWLEHPGQVVCIAQQHGATEASKHQDSKDITWLAHSGPQTSRQHRQAIDHLSKSHFCANIQETKPVQLYAIKILLRFDIMSRLDPWVVT